MPMSASRTRRHDLVNPAALKRLVQTGTQLRPFSNEDHGGLPQSDQRTLDENFGQNADFKKSHRSDAGLSKRSVSLMAGGRIHQRQLHDPIPFKELNALPLFDRLSCGSRHIATTSDLPICILAAPAVFFGSLSR
jgi:hypothetical protein